MSAVRILCRLVRRATKPLRLWLVECQIEKSREIALCLEGQRVEAALQIQEENEYQAQLAARRMAIERGVA